MIIRLITILALVVAMLAIISITFQKEDRTVKTFSYPTGFGDEVIVLTCSSDSVSPTTQQQADFVHQFFLERLDALSEASAEAMHNEMQSANETGDLPDFASVEANRDRLLYNLTNNIEQQFGCIVR